MADATIRTVIGDIMFTIVIEESIASIVSIQAGMQAAVGCGSRKSNQKSRKPRHGRDLAKVAAPGFEPGTRGL